jgi:hypothetical protein
MLSKNPNLTAAELKSKIGGTANRTGNEDPDRNEVRLLDACRAVKSATNVDDPAEPQLLSPVSSPPIAPASLNACQGPGYQIQFSWSDVGSDSCNEIDHYEFSLLPPAGSGLSSVNKSVNGTTTSHTICGSAPLGPWTWVITAKDKFGNPSRDAVRSFSLEGIPAISVSPVSFAFGNVFVGQTSLKDFTIENTGTGTLPVNSVRISPGTGFILQTPTTPFNIAPNASNTFSVKFAPTAVGVFQSSVTIASNDPVSPRKAVAVSGTGVAVVPLPTAVNDGYAVSQGGVLTVNPPGLLSNDIIPAGVTPSVEFLPPFPPAGLTNTSGNGGFVLDLRPNPTFVGTLTLLYVIHTVNGDSNTATVTVQVTAAVSAPTCSLTANPATISQGQSSTLTWTTTGNPTRASIDNGVGTVTPPAGGSVNISPAATTTYTLTVSNSAGSSTCSAAVSVEDRRQHRQ